jgi:O-antigen/teichoic acid export membrane protein
MALLRRLRKTGSFADQALVSGGNFLTIAVCANLLPLAEQGKFTYMFASYMALLLLNVAGIFQGAATRAPAQDGAYQTTMARLQLLQSFMLSLLVSATWLMAGGVFGWQATIIEAALLLVFLMLQQQADFTRRAAYIFSRTKDAVYASAALYPLRIIGLLVFKPETIGQVLVILGASAMLPAIPAVLMAFRKRTAGTSSWTKATREHLVYSRLFIAGAPLGWLWSYLPIFMLGIFQGKEQVALLASIRGITNLGNVLMEQVEIKVVADWARLHHGSGSRAMEADAARLLNIGILIWVLGLVVAVTFGREIVGLILGSLYVSHWHLLVIGWIGYGVYFHARIFSIKQRVLGLNHVEFFGNLSGVFAALISGFAMIPAFSAAGAAWTYVIVAAVMLASQMLVLKMKR